MEALAYICKNCGKITLAYDCGFEGYFEKGYKALKRENKLTYCWKEQEYPELKHKIVNFSTNSTDQKIIEDFKRYFPYNSKCPRGDKDEIARMLVEFERDYNKELVKIDTSYCINKIDKKYMRDIGAGETYAVRYYYDVTATASLVDPINTDYNIDVTDLFHFQNCCALCGATDVELYEENPKRIGIRDEEVGKELTARIERADSITSEEYVNNLTSELVLQYKCNSRTIESEYSIMEYMKQLIDINCSIIYYQKLLKSLYCDSINVKRSINYSRFLLQHDLGEYDKKIKELKIKHDEKRLNNPELLPERITVDMYVRENNLTEPKEPQKPVLPDLEAPVEPIIKKASLFNKKRVDKENAEALEQYSKAKSAYDLTMKEYEVSLKFYYDNISDYPNKKESFYRMIENRIAELIEKNKKQNEIVMQRHNQEIDKLGVQINNLEGEKNEVAANRERQMQEYLEFFQKEISESKDTLAKLIERRERMQSLGIIHPKYHDIVALTSICELFETGRCSDLKGFDGAYNIYENDLKANIIISKMDVIIDSLEQIKNNQYMLYDKLCDIEMQLKQVRANTYAIADGVKKCAYQLGKANQKLQNISENTNVTAYYTKKNSQLLEVQNQLTDTLCWLTVLN